MIIRNLSIYPLADVRRAVRFGVKYVATPSAKIGIAICDDVKQPFRILATQSATRKIKTSMRSVLPSRIVVIAIGGPGFFASPCDILIGDSLPDADGVSRRSCKEKARLVDALDGVVFLVAQAVAGMNIGSILNDAKGLSPDLYAYHALKDWQKKRGSIFAKARAKAIARAEKDEIW